MLHWLKYPQAFVAKFLANTGKLEKLSSERFEFFECCLQFDVAIPEVQARTIAGKKWSLSFFHSSMHSSNRTRLQACLSRLWIEWLISPFHTASLKRLCYASLCEHKRCDGRFKELHLWDATAGKWQALNLFDLLIRGFWNNKTSPMTFCWVWPTTTVRSKIKEQQPATFTNWQ